jgi:RNA polymerase sigma-70 factor (ECF subfamily)
MADHEEFLRLFMPLQGELLAFILAAGVSSADADDVLQNAAVVMWRKFDTFEPGTNYRAWAFAVLRFEIRKTFSSRATRVLSLTDGALADLEAMATAEPEPPQTRVKALVECLGRLRPNARSLVDLRYRTRLSVGDIARRLRRPVDSIYTTLSRIRKTLGECVERAIRREA